MQLKRLLFFAIVILTLFSSILNTQITWAQNSAEDISSAIKKNYECGTIGQKCCKKKINLPKTRVPSPDIPVLGSIIGVILSPVNTLVSLGDPLINWLEDKVSDLWGRPPCSEGEDSGTKNMDTCICLKKEAFNIGILCTGIKTQAEISKCVSCSGHGVWTAVGCVDFKLGSFAASIFGVGIGFAGGVALLCILYSALLYQTSQGNPERLKKAREYLTNCIMGLILIFFSILILKITGVNILAIPGFS